MKVPIQDSYFSLAPANTLFLIQPMKTIYLLSLWSASFFSFRSMKVLIPPDRFPLSQLTDGKKNCNNYRECGGEGGATPEVRNTKDKRDEMKVAELRCH